ncbi:MAG TPA: BTAD domain-containing putative transcriptional regulator [Longimicrobiaceae bacterium]
MIPLRIRLFGGLHLSRGDEPLPAFPTQRARSLFAYVALHRSRLHARELVIGQLWGDESESIGRKALRMALWRVRGVVDPPADAAEPSPLRVSGTALGFNSDAAYWLDVEEFEHLLRAVAPRPDGTLDEDDAQRLRSAIDLYAGDLLEDIYDDWCLYDRERLRLLYHGALERLMRFEEERSAWAAAIALGQRLLALDPLMEQVHREMMRCYVRRGSRAAALRQFESCARVLRAELDVDPMPETIDLYLRIRGGADPSPDEEPESEPEALLQRVDRALEALHDLADQLEETRTRLHLPEPAAP